MKNVFIFILFALTITSCLETNINDTLPFEEKAVAFGFLDSVYGARVFVGKNVSIFSKDSSAVKNAHVSLWSDDGLVENLTYFDKSGNRHSAYLVPYGYPSNAPESLHAACLQFSPVGLAVPWPAVACRW